MSSLVESLELSIGETYSSTVKLAQNMQVILVVLGILYGSFVTPYQNLTYLIALHSDEKVLSEKFRDKIKVLIILN